MKTKSLLPSVLRFAAVVLALGAAATSRAHSVWIEDLPDKKLVVRFGEPGAEFEQSPGYLDQLSLPVAWQPGADGKPAPFTVEKKSDHFLFVAAAPAVPALGETVFPVMKRGDRPASLPHFYVRWHPVGAPAPTGPALLLDLVPTENTGEFRVYLRGKPLSNATIVVHQGSSENEITADGEGRFRFKPTGAGLVLLTCNHKEALLGFSAGAAYEITSHNTALSWRQP